MIENTLRRIKKYIDFKGIRVSLLEKEVGLSNGSFASQLKNNKTIGVDKLENILKKYNDINPEWLLTGRGSMLKTNEIEEFVTGLSNKKSQKTNAECNIPLYDVQTAEGIADLFGNNINQNPVSFVNVPKISDYDGALYVVGDSMYPMLKSGDIVIYKIINKPENNIVWGELYLIYVNNDDNEYFFTRYIMQSERDDFVKFVSHNPHHQTIEFSIKSIKALALVKGSVRINSQF